MMRTFVAAFGCAAILALVPAAAEDAGRGIGYAAAGPVFDLPAGISVARQDVDISLDSVRLTYVFKTSRRGSVHFSFALPEMPVDAGEDIAALDKNSEAAGLAADTQPANYLRLSVSVNGGKLTLGGHGRALLNGKDVTRQLRDAGVPLLSGPDGATWRHLTPDVRTELEANGLMTLDAAAWTYQAEFAWDTVLEPGETRVEVSYATLAKYWSDITVDHFPEIAPGGSATRAFCIDDALRRVFFRKPFSYDIYTVTNLAASSKGWHGPVGHYRLVVDKGAATNLVAFCPPAARKISPTTFEWTATNYTPGGQTGVLFFVAPESAMPGDRK